VQVDAEHEMRRADAPAHQRVEDRGVAIKQDMLVLGVGQRGTEESSRCTERNHRLATDAPPRASCTSSWADAGVKRQHRQLHAAFWKNLSIHDTVDWQVQSARCGLYWQRVRWPVAGCLYAKVPDAPVTSAVRWLSQITLLFGAANAGYK
jgi:hypothetical protein